MKIRCTPRGLDDQITAAGVPSTLVKTWRVDGDTGVIEVDLSVALTSAQLAALADQLGMKVDVVEA